jgi:hypothetical protein
MSKFVKAVKESYHNKPRKDTVITLGGNEYHVFAKKPTPHQLAVLDRYQEQKGGSVHHRLAKICQLVFEYEDGSKVIKLDEVEELAANVDADDIAQWLTDLGYGNPADLEREDIQEMELQEKNSGKDQPQLVAEN